MTRSIITCLKQISVYSPRGVKLENVIRINVDTGEATLAIPLYAMPNNKTLEEIQAIDPNYWISKGDSGFSLIHFKCPELRIELNS